MKVVCIKSHSDQRSGIKKGMQFYILSTKKCACGIINYDVGISLPDDYIWSRCACGLDAVGPIWWIDSCLFAPIISRSDEFLSSDKIEKSAEERIDIELPITVN